MYAIRSYYVGAQEHAGEREWQTVVDRRGVEHLFVFPVDFGDPRPQSHIVAGLERR